MRFRVIPEVWTGMKVAIIEIGMAVAMIAVLRAFLKKRRRIKMAKSPP
jgi:hypothetical protein